jgi:hypothetical protein
MTLGLWNSLDASVYMPDTRGREAKGGEWERKTF